ncbi:MAG: DUF1059 domain-containing protein [Nitrospirae bacterium]|nr:DUF1059 domain-containing protein [Nitrospirota bacterium]
MFEVSGLSGAKGKEMKTMEENLKKVECDPACGFMIKSHDEKEIIETVRQHAKRYHKKAVSEKEVKEMMKAA